MKDTFTLFSFDLLLFMSASLLKGATVVMNKILYCLMSTRSFFIIIVKKKFQYILIFLKQFSSCMHKLL